MPGLASVSMVSCVDELLDSEAKCSNYICRDIKNLCLSEICNVNFREIIGA